MNVRWICTIAILVWSLLVGCSSTLPEQSRQKAFTSFIKQTEHLQFYWPSSLTWEDNRFGSNNLGKEFSESFNLEFPVIGLMEKFNSISGLPNMRIVTPEEIKKLSLNPNMPVFYFTSSWALIYRRLPPNLFLNKLRMGVVAKVIPLGQVLEGKGPIALRTSAWEGNCTAEAFDGNFFSREEWEAENGTRLKQGLEELQAKCGERLAMEFMKEKRDVQ